MAGFHIALQPEFSGSSRTVQFFHGIFQAPNDPKFHHLPTDFAVDSYRFTYQKKSMKLPFLPTFIQFPKSFSYVFPFIVHFPCLGVPKHGGGSPR
jgi:hypothetical protein